MLAADPQIKVLVVVAPALGFTFGHTGAPQCTSQLNFDGSMTDQILCARHYADAVPAAPPRLCRPRPPDGSGGRQAMG